MAITGNPNAIGAMNKALSKFLLANVASLEMAIDGWPAPNQKLKYPAISIFAKIPKYTHLQPYVIKKNAIVNHRATVLRCVGMYDFELQMDLWCSYKPQRDSLVENVINAFNLDPDSPGANLILEDYYNEPIHLSMASVQYMQDEAAAERNEWRAMLTIECNLRVITSQTNYLMENIENTLETPLQIDTTDDDAGEMII